MLYIVQIEESCSIRGGGSNTWDTSTKKLHPNLVCCSCLDASSHKNGKFYHTRDCMYSPSLKESSGNCQFSFSIPFLGLNVGHC